MTAPQKIRKEHSDAVQQLTVTMRRAAPHPIPRSLRSMAAKLFADWQNKRFHGHQFIHPGMSKLANWAEVSTRQARDNLRQLESWGAVIPVAYEKGGRRATRLVVSGEALFRALVHMGCNPHQNLRQRLSRYDLQNPEVVGSFSILGQTDKPEHLGADDAPENPEVSEVENPEENPEVTSAGIHIIPSDRSRRTRRKMALADAASLQSAQPHEAVRRISGHDAPQQLSFFDLMAEVPGGKLPAEKRVEHGRTRAPR